MSDENLSRGVSRKKRMWWCLSRERERGRGQRKRDENKGADLGEGCQHRAVSSFFNDISHMITPFTVDRDRHDGRAPRQCLWR